MEVICCIYFTNVFSQSVPLRSDEKWCFVNIGMFPQSGVLDNVTLQSVLRQPGPHPHTQKKKTSIVLSLTSQWKQNKQKRSSRLNGWGWFGLPKQKPVSALECHPLSVMGWKEHGCHFPLHPWLCAERPEYGSVCVTPSSSFCNFAWNRAKQ